MAAERGNLIGLKMVVKGGADLDKRNHMARTALHMAIAGNYRSCVKLLLESGANTAGVTSETSCKKY
jgi:ankyrin repeat protein